MNPATSSLLDLFPDAAFRHRMRFQPGTVASFFGRTPNHEALLAERRRWLDADASAYVGALPEGAALLDEALALLRSAQVLDADFPAHPLAGPGEKAVALGRCLEPDFMLLRPDESDTFRLVAGCVCFPSSWSLAEKMGHPLEFIHGVVPELNAQLARPIHMFLAKLPPGEASQRSNWGLSRSPELNQHPSRHLRRLDATVELDEVWLRVEHQILVRLPQTGGILFGIRLANHPLSELQRDADLKHRFRLALETMSEAMAEYKSVASARARLVALLG